MTLAMDFGTCNTVLARWDPVRQAVEMVRIDGLTRDFEFLIPGASEASRASVIPSLIHYGEGAKLLLGEQVAQAGLTDHVGTFRWLKLDMLHDTVQTKYVNGKFVPLRQAAGDLVRSVLAFGLGAAGEEERDLVVTLPVEAYDRYGDWLSEEAGKAFPGTIRMIDEATACVLGYQHMVRNDEVYVVFDFGGGTLDVSVVKVSLETEGAVKCTILGRSGEEIGGHLIDSWMLERLTEAGAVTAQDVTDVGTRLMRLIEDAKIALSNGAPDADITQLNDYTGRLISHTFSRADLEEVLRRHEVSRLVARTVSRALDAAQSRYGTLRTGIKGVFMVGGTSLLLGVVDTVRAIFPEAPVRCDRPFEAIAAGACRYGGEDLNPLLVHDYVRRVWDPEMKDYRDVKVVEKGTRYPTDGVLGARYLGAAAPETDALGLVIEEISDMVLPETKWEIGADGKLRKVSEGTRSVSQRRAINPADRKFIRADPPCRFEERRRFVVAFGVDRNKRLVVSLNDTRPGSRSFVMTASGEKFPLPIRDFPLVKL